MIRKIAPCSGNIIIVARLRILPVYAYLCCNQNQSRMKTNLRKSLWAALTLALTLSACGGSNAKKTDNETAQPDTTLVMTDSITTVSLRTGDTKLTWLKDNAGEKLMPRTLFPDATDGLIDSLALTDGIPSTISVFLAERERKLILFDTGNGAPQGHMAEEMKHIGVSPADIKLLYLTHFHSDHIGGMMRGDTVLFPNAEVYASKAEYEAWMQMPKEQNALVVKTMEAYKDRLHLFEFGDTLPGGVVALDAAGHTPGHTAYRAGQFLIVGDLMHGVALQREHPDICASFDMDKGASATARKRIMQYAEDNDLRMAGMHFPAPGFLMK